MCKISFFIVNTQHFNIFDLKNNKIDRSQCWSISFYNVATKDLTRSITHCRMKMCVIVIVILTNNTCSI